MPTYSFICLRCRRTDEVFMSLGQYVKNAPAFVCCRERMERHIAHAPGLGVTSEKHYDGLRAQDGTDIGTRAKHREYMKRNNLTTVDDFKNTWQVAAQQRAAALAGEDPSRKRDLVEAVQKLGG